MTMVSMITSLEQRIADRLVDLRAEIRADPLGAVAFEQAIGEIRRLCREADDLSVAGVTSCR